MGGKAAHRSLRAFARRRLRVWQTVIVIVEVGFAVDIAVATELLGLGNPCNVIV